jgi:hypothetical protein
VVREEALPLCRSRHLPRADCPELWRIYAEEAAREGYQAGSENFGYLQPVFVSDDQKRAEELGKRYLFGGHFAHFARPEWMFPPGYNSKEPTARLARQFANANMPGRSMVADWQEGEDAGEVRKKIYDRFPIAQQDLQLDRAAPSAAPPWCGEGGARLRGVISGDRRETR